MDNTVLRNAGVALMQSTDAFNFVDGMTLPQIGQALYDFSVMREKYPALRDAKEAFEDHLRRSEWIQKNEDKLFDGMWGYHRDDAVRIVVERLMSERDRLRSELDASHDGEDALRSEVAKLRAQVAALQPEERRVGPRKNEFRHGEDESCDGDAIRRALRTSAQAHNVEGATNAG